MSYLVIIDWGTSYLRAYLCLVAPDGNLNVLDSRLGEGVKKNNDRFEQELFKQIKPWVDLYGKFSIFMAGQIGSSIGWKETAYLSCPIKPENIAKSCLTFKSQEHKIFIVPGVSCRTHNENYDVMRGEELQVLGWLQLSTLHRKGQHLLCLPGTHTKWVLIDDGEIQLFKTAMTGELYDLLSNQSVLIQESSHEYDTESFYKGAKYTLNSELGSFSHGIFSVRSNQIFGELKPPEASSYLSGLLIGSDVRAALYSKEWDIHAFKQVVIIGAPHLSQCFSNVLMLKSIATQVCDVQQTLLHGFSFVYQNVSLRNK